MLYSVAQTTMAQQQMSANPHYSDVRTVRSSPSRGSSALRSNSVNRLNAPTFSGSAGPGCTAVYSSNNGQQQQQSEFVPPPPKAPSPNNLGKRRHASTSSTAQQQQQQQQQQLAAVQQQAGYDCTASRTSSRRGSEKQQQQQQQESDYNNNRIMQSTSSFKSATGGSCQTPYSNGKVLQQANTRVAPTSAAKHAGNNPTTKRETPSPPVSSEYQPLLPEVILDPSMNRYLKIGEYLGKGGFAWCYRVTDVATGEELAIKVIAKSWLTKQHHHEKVDREIRIHKNVSHQHVVKLHTAFTDEYNIYILLEYCKHRSIVNVLRHRQVLTEPECRHYIGQLLLALTHLHEQCGVLHRDIKLGNMLLNEHMEVKLGDFGLASDRLPVHAVPPRNQQQASICGTPNYISPEILRKEGHSVASESWAVGCVLYAMLHGKPPFETKELDKTYALISQCHYELLQGLSEPAAHLIKLLLHPDAYERPSPRDILAHPFMTDPLVVYPMLESFTQRPPVGDEFRLLRPRRPSLRTVKPKPQQQQHETNDQPPDYSAVSVSQAQQQGSSNSLFRYAKPQVSSNSGTPPALPPARQQQQQQQSNAIPTSSRAAPSLTNTPAMSSGCFSGGGGGSSLGLGSLPLQITPASVSAMVTQGIAPPNPVYPPHHRLPAAVASGNAWYRISSATSSPTSDDSSSSSGDSLNTARLVCLPAGALNSSQSAGSTATCSLNDTLNNNNSEPPPLPPRPHFPYRSAALAYIDSDCSGSNKKTTASAPLAVLDELLPAVSTASSGPTPVIAGYSSNGPRTPSPTATRLGSELAAACRVSSASVAVGHQQQQGGCASPGSGDSGVGSEPATHCQQHTPPVTAGNGLPLLPDAGLSLMPTALQFDTNNNQQQQPQQATLTSSRQRAAAQQSYAPSAMGGVGSSNPLVPAMPLHMLDHLAVLARILNEHTAPLANHPNIAYNDNCTLALPHAQPLPSSASKQVPFVRRWIDYTNKHGFGAQFSDGRDYVWFTDGSTLVASPVCEGVISQYVFRPSASAGHRCCSSQVSFTSLDQLQPDMAERVRILNRFYEFMECNLSSGRTLHESAAAGSAGPHLLSWHRDPREQYVLFVLSGGYIQVNNKQTRQKLLLRLLGTDSCEVTLLRPDAQPGTTFVIDCKQTSPRPLCLSTTEVHNLWFVSQCLDHCRQQLGMQQQQQHINTGYNTAAAARLKVTNC